MVIYTYIYIYIERERGTETDRQTDRQTERDREIEGDCKPPINPEPVVCVVHAHAAGPGALDEGGTFQGTFFLGPYNKDPTI